MFERWLGRGQLERIVEYDAWTPHKMWSIGTAFPIENPKLTGQ